MNAGGGIMSRARDPRGEPGRAWCFRPARGSIACWPSTTTAEAKTGYGLELAAELKMLDAIAAAGC